MDAFKSVVQDLVQRGLKKQHTVQGFIPQNGVDFARWTCTVRVPDQHQAMESGVGLAGGSYLEYTGVPLPRQLDGLLHSIKAKVWNQDCGVLVGFRGSDLFPYIVGFLDLNHSQDGKQKSSVANRQPLVTQNFLTDGQAALPSLATQQWETPAPNLQSKTPLPIPTPGPAPTNKVAALSKRALELAVDVSLVIARLPVRR